MKAHLCDVPKSDEELVLPVRGIQINVGVKLEITAEKDCSSTFLSIGSTGDEEEALENKE